MSSDQLVAHGTVRGVFFSLGTTPSHDPRLDCGKAIIDRFFDGRTVCTGSFNWTNAAEKRNDENLLIVDGTQVANAYEKFVFQRILAKETLVEPD